MADFDKQYYVGVSALGRIIARKKEVKKRLRQEKEIFALWVWARWQAFGARVILRRKLKVGPLMKVYVATEHRVSHTRLPLQKRLVHDIS